MSKSELRDSMLSLRASINTEIKRILDTSLRDNLVSKEIIDIIESRSIEDIFMYYPLETEANIMPLFEFFKARGMKVYFPKVSISDKTMDFYEVNSKDETNFIKSNFGVYEPIEEVGATSRLISENKSILCIVPGVCFSKNHKRVGYGAGYYDRYFSANKGLDIVKIGCCYELQLVEDIETDIYDVPMDYIVTEHVIIN